MTDLIEEVREHTAIIGTDLTKRICDALAAREQPAQQEAPSVGLRVVAKRNLRSLIVGGSTDKELMLRCLEELS